MLTLPIDPMEPVLWPEPFDDPDWLFQVKWDGIRAIAAVEGRTVRLFGKHGDERTALYPDLVAALPAGVRAHQAVLDGEIVAFAEGKPSFTQVMRRALSRNPERTAQRIPAFYVPFDLLEVAGQPLVDMPVRERLERLSHILASHERVLTMHTSTHGTALFEAVRSQQLEGIVAKQAESPYVFGKSPLWRKVKVRRRLNCVVVGFTQRGGILRSLLLGAYDESDQLRYLGAAGSGLAEAHLQRLAQVLQPMAVASSPVVDRVPRDLSLRWVAPALTVTVEYLERTEDGHLRHPVIVDFPSVPPESCRLPEV